MDDKLTHHKVDEDRENKLIELLSMYKSPQEAARKAGYSEQYSRNITSNKFKSERFLNRLQQHYNGNSTLLLPLIHKAERKVVELVSDNPDDLAKHRHTIKEIKQSAGVLAPDTQPRQATINIKEVRNLMLQVHNSRQNNDASV